jgi:putative glutamine amidotransferase
MSSRRPVIGICAAIETVAWSGWEVVCNLPPDDTVAERPDEVLDLIDGLILAGGSDVDPGTYGARPHPETRGTRPERDRFELALAHRALERDMPVLGVCRGMQMLNVACGGTLDQHLPDSVGHEDHRHTPGVFSDHEVRLDPDSLAARAVGAELTAVKSHHHQGLDELGEGLVVSGRSTADDLVEAIELPGRPYALGVLWHPEEDERSRVVGSLVEAARSNHS